MKSLWQLNIKTAADRIKHQISVGLKPDVRNTWYNHSSNANTTQTQVNTNGGVARKSAAVLVPLFEDGEDNISVWLTKRSSTKVSTHRGEVSFPGGKTEERDASPACTARREALEEVGIDCKQEDIIGNMNPLLSKHGLIVTPVVSILPKDHPIPRPQTGEVDICFKAPLSTFMNTEGHTSKLYYHKGIPYTVHFFQYVDEHNQEHLIWGLTAYILIEVASIVYDRQPFFSKHLSPSSM